MTNDEKNLLMQPLYKIAAHNGLPDAELVSFKKRSKLLDALKEKNEAGWTVINGFIETQIKLDRINNDKEKQEKNTLQWTTEIAAAEAEKNAAQQNLDLYLSEQKI